jgi:Fic family protein
MFEYTELSHRGEFKKEDNVICERYPDGRTNIRFMTVKAVDTLDAMKELTYAYMEARDDSNINQLLLIPCVILDFLCIHPFQDGNGTMSRLLSLLLMYKNGFDISKYVSFEEQINLSKGNYYEALRQSSIGWHDNTNDYIPFIENFLFTLYLCYKELDKRFLTIKSGKVSKTKRIEEIVLTSFIPISKKEIINLLPDISVTTIEKVLSNMMKDGKIVKIGSTSNAKYLKK